MFFFPSTRTDASICRVFCLLIVSLFLIALRPARAQGVEGLPEFSVAGELGQTLFERSGSTGMVMVVVRNNQVYFQGYGETAPRSHRKPDAHSFVRLCSLSKIFTTDLMAKLAADRTVSFDDPLQRYAPQGVVVPSRGAPITLKDLATHTAGLPRELGVAPDGTTHFTFPDYATRWRLLPRYHLMNTPGTAANYSNIGFDLLSDALQAAGRKSYATLLAEHTLNPLGMHQTTFYPHPEQCARLLVGALHSDLCVVTENTQGSSGLYSTPTDMATWLKYLLGTGGSLPKQPATAQAIVVRPEQLRRQIGLNYAGQPSGIGLGWIHVQPEGYPSAIIQKTGGGAGFVTYLAFNQARHTAIFIAATEGSRAGSGNLFHAANKILITMAGLPPLPSDAPRALKGRAARLASSRATLVKAKQSGRAAPRGRLPKGAQKVARNRSATPAKSTPSRKTTARAKALPAKKSAPRTAKSTGRKSAPRRKR
jgi:D-alanyl-D-alanine-carboxypeptidase/D-alanyl-D-alanine-endopeptidase